MSYPLLAVMNISHRYFDLEEFFSSAAASGYTCCELWTGAMHLYVDCHGYQNYGLYIVNRDQGKRTIGLGVVSGEISIGKKRREATGREANLKERVISAV